LCWMSLTTASLESRQLELTYTNQSLEGQPKAAFNWKAHFV